MFNKEQYWLRRNANKRGQGEDPKPSFYAKGEKVPYMKKVKGKLKKAFYANDLGSHMVQFGPKLISNLNRAEARRYGWRSDYHAKS